MFDLLKTINSKGLKSPIGGEVKPQTSEQGAPGEFDLLLNESQKNQNLGDLKTVKEENLFDQLFSRNQNTVNLNSDKESASIAKSGQEDLFKIFNSSDDSDVKLAQLNEMLESGKITEADIESLDLSSVNPQVLDQILTSAPVPKNSPDLASLTSSSSKTTGPLNLGLNKSTKEIENGIIVAKQDESLAENSKIDHRLMSQLSKTNNSQKVQPQVISNSSINYSEDFINQRMNQGLNQKPQITSKSNAFNVFRKEQSLLDDTGIIKNKAFTDMNQVKANFNSNAPQKLDMQKDSLTSAEELSVDPNQIDNISQMPKSEYFQSQTSSQIDTKVVDLSNVQSKEQVISEITKYIEQSKIQNGRELDVMVSHKDLGQFRVNAQRSASGDLVDLKIMTSSAEGNNFFNQNEVSLLKSLQNSGVKVSDIKISMMDTSHTASSGNDSAGQNNSGNGQGFARNYNGGGDFHNQGKQRRQELWENYREQMGA